MRVNKKNCKECSRQQNWQKRQQEKKKGNGRSGNIKMNFTFDDDMSEEDPDYRLDLSDSAIEADAKWSKYKFEQERTQ